MSGNKQNIGSNLDKVDAHVIAASDYDEIPELTDDMFDRADLYQGEKLIRRGRPKADQTKKHVSLRLDGDVLNHFKADGRGWQTRLNQALRKAAGL